MGRLYFKPISCSLSPNVDSEDVRCAISALMHLGSDNGNVRRNEVIRLLAARFPGRRVGLAGSARSALAESLRMLGIKAGDEVVLQAFTCMVVVDAILTVGAKPVYADIDDTYNVNPETVARVLTKKTKAVIIQHTFGIPVDLDRMGKLRNRHGFALIEDCAHGLGASYAGKPVGSFGDAAVLSFGRDKVISSVWGGASIWSSDTEFVPGPMKTAPKWWVAKQLLHPVLFKAALPTYGIGIGKVFVQIAKKLGIVSLPVEACEKTGGLSLQSGYAYPEAFARLLVPQLKKLDGMVERRRKIAKMYRNGLSNVVGIKLPPDVPGSSWLRFPIMLDSSAELISTCRSQGIYLGTWYRDLIDPAGSSKQIAGYGIGMCPVAERMSERVVNLPTHVSPSDAQKIIDIVCAFKGKR